MDIPARTSVCVRRCVWCLGAEQGAVVQGYAHMFALLQRHSNFRKYALDTWTLAQLALNDVKRSFFFSTFKK